MNRGTILLAEDNPDDEALALRSLRRNNIANEIYVAHDGVEATEYIFSEGARSGEPLPSIAIALLDIKMPRVSGLEVLQRIRAAPQVRHMPVVMLTSSDEEKDLVRSYELGVNSYVKKPVDFVEFSSAVADLGLYWLLLNRSPERNNSSGS